MFIWRLHTLRGWSLLPRAAPSGLPEVITRGIKGSTFDDFALREDGAGLLAKGLGVVNGIEKVSKSGKAQMVAQ